MYKNRVKNDKFFLKFPLFYLANEEIQRGKIPNNIYILNFPTPFSTGFSRSQDKRAGIRKKFLSFSTQFLYIPCFIYSPFFSTDCTVLSTQNILEFLMKYVWHVNIILLYIKYVTQSYYKMYKFSDSSFVC